MKKIALVTCYFQYNYGSMLQAYATQKICEDWGLPCENINIEKLKSGIEKRKIKFYLKQINNPQIVTGTIFRICKKALYKRLFKKALGRSLDIRNEKFRQFINERFILSIPFDSREKLAEACVNYSTVLVGSDQLWLPSNIDADYYTLTWVPDEVNKVSYATSFGISFLPENLRVKTKDFLSRFNYISVREESGKKIVHECAAIDVPVVCDPTLLFTSEEWMCVQKAERIVAEKYILCYFLGNNTEDRGFAKRLREKTGYKLVALLYLDEYIKTDSDYADYTPFDIGPGELLNLIRNAEYIVTDSFHGSVFSILYKKVFFTSRRIRKEGILNTNSRLDSLFTLLGIEGRVIEGSENIDECLNKSIDYESVYSKLTIVREQSLDYLRSALKF